jgi:hypothetical protein
MFGPGQCPVAHATIHGLSERRVKSVWSETYQLSDGLVDGNASVVVEVRVRGLMRYEDQVNIATVIHRAYSASIFVVLHDDRARECLWRSFLSSARIKYAPGEHVRYRCCLVSRIVCLNRDRLLARLCRIHVM